MLEHSRTSSWICAPTCLNTLLIRLHILLKISWLSKRRGFRLVDAAVIRTVFGSNFSKYFAKGIYGNVCKIYKCQISVFSHFSQVAMYSIIFFLITLCMPLYFLLSRSSSVTASPYAWRNLSFLLFGHTAAFGLGTGIRFKSENGVQPTNKETVNWIDMHCIVLVFCKIPLNDVSSA